MKDKNTTTELAGALLGNSNATISPEIQAELQKLLLEKIKFDLEDDNERRQEKFAKKAQREAQRRIIREEVEKELAKEQLAQAQCTHKKANGQTALAGIRDHNRNLVLICQNCGKQYINNDAPQELMPSGSAIGGPMY